MAVLIKVPDMGESVIDATITKWLRSEGETVAAGEALVELETDKVSLEVSSPQAGILQKIAHQAGETVAVGENLATLEPLGAEAPASETEPLGEKAIPKSLGAEAPAEAPASKALPEAAAAIPAAGTPEDGGLRVTPLAQRMAEEMGVDLKKVSPTGPGGRVTKEDVQAFIAQTPAAASPVSAPVVLPQPPVPASKPAVPPAAGETPNRREERVRMSRRRQTIARRMVEAQHTAAMLTTFNEIDMGAVMDLRKRRREAFKERNGVDLGYMSFFITASIAALKAFPRINAEIQGDEIVLKYYYDIGVAIGDEEGLVVPVIRDADRLNFAGIEKAIREFSAKVKGNTLSLEDLRGGTFTITNGGVFGSLMSTPILNPPQVAILAMHGIKERPVAANGQVVIRPMMYVALSYDHRIVDGREAVQFLVRIKELIEDPEALLFG